MAIILVVSVCINNDSEDDTKCFELEYKDPSIECSDYHISLVYLNMCCFCGGGNDGGENVEFVCHNDDSTRDS